ncbi:ELMO/CED-12 family-domain-containing protein [Flagelloscypha sp. PMI_526]|nr:ELMO/CED-12 family-domain-containing protein [Flagelloscypha sp. PMI_526]
MSSPKTPTINGSRPTTAALVPTNTVATLDGQVVRARIDATLTVDDVVRQLCINLNMSEPAANFALRNETGELVTNDNLRRMIRGRVNLRLVRAPAIEARETADKLAQRDPQSLRSTVHALTRLIREEEFAQVFLTHNGLAELVDVIHSTNGNTLAYALTALQNLMELDYGWSRLEDTFILRLVRILVSRQALINVCRPATAILKKLVEADPSRVPGPMAGSSRSANPQVTTVYQYGFPVVFAQIRKEPAMLETVVGRLGGGETAMVQHSMMLINSLLAHASDEYWGEFIAMMESLNVTRAVVRLMSTHTNEDLTSCILDFQANWIRVVDSKKRTMPDPDTDTFHAAMLKFIWQGAKLEEDLNTNNEVVKWRKLGFGTEDVIEEFKDVGVLGLECLEKFVRGAYDFAQIVLEQLSRPDNKRCPIGKASNEVVELLSEHWAIFAPGYSTSTTFQPFFLDFYRVHSLATRFFIRMWGESNSELVDFPGVVALVRSQIKVALKSENTRPWHEVEASFLECEYRAIRERQMRELELEDDLLSRVPIRNLRATLYKESFEFVRQQRIQCLLQGAWFYNAIPETSLGLAAPKKPTRPWRFMRVDHGLKYLHFVDAMHNHHIRQGLEDLPGRIEISAISEISTGTCAAAVNFSTPPDPAGLPPQHPLAPSPLSFSLLSAHSSSLVDVVAPDQTTWADWTDGLNMLRRDGGHVTSQETAGFVQALTEIGLKIKLLDLSGEMVEIPSGLVAGPPPPNTDFFFSDL